MKKERFEELERGMGPSLRMKLVKLRDYLRQNKASVMVGSGFSKNARMGEDVVMKDWGELCEDFFKALYNRAPEDKDFRLKSALRLAQQIESTMGRTALDEIIMDSLPNDSISPGKLHELLVSLRWRDIFTTNYDTLLEEAALKIYKHYNLVTSKDSLIYQPHPRIVKLHGSFRDNRPFIITEEDYRTYPDRFPEFVNTIRQALIETQFCLIGFSGDDPNFLNWLGWFRDIMGPQMLPIYMIYVGDQPHEAELNLLHFRKVVPIVTGEISHSPEVAMEFILSFIGDVFTPEWRWSGKLQERRLLDTDLTALTAEMRSIRESYPGWVILPLKNMRREFSDCFREFPFFQSKFKELTDERKLDFLYEYSWRLEASCVPFWFENDWFAKGLEFFADDMNVEVVVANSLQRDNDRNKAKEIRKKAEYLTLVLLKYYRITDSGKFKDLLGYLKDRPLINGSSARRKLIYEEALFLLSHCEERKLQELLANWTVYPDDYVGSLWKGKILMESGDFKEAGKLLEDAIGNVRRKLLTNGKSKYLQSALALLTKCRGVAKQEYGEKTDINEEFRLLDYLDWFKSEMRIKEKYGMSETHGFNIGNSGREWNMGESGFFERFIGAGRYFMFAEAFGLPVGSVKMSINADVANMALPLLSDVSLKATFPYIVECANEKGFEGAVTRSEILDLNRERATALFDEWTAPLLPYFNKEKDIKWRSREMNVILPFVARICVWLDAERIERVINFIIANFDPAVSMLAVALRTCYNSLPEEKQVEYWWKVMNMPIRPNPFSLDIPRPIVKIKSWEGNGDTVGFIIKGLESDNRDVNRMAVGRYSLIRHILPQEESERLDEVIARRFEALLHTDLILILGREYKTGVERAWNEILRSHVVLITNKQSEKDYEFKGSSDVIDDFSDTMAVFIDCQAMLRDFYDLEMVPIIDISRFIFENHDAILNSHDGHEIMGGMKSCWSSALRLASIYIAETVTSDISRVGDDTRDEIFNSFVEFSEEYPVMRGLVCLSMLYKDKDTEASRRDMLMLKLKEGVTAKDDMMLEDAFDATVKWHELTKGRVSVQEIIGRAIDRVRYFFDRTSLNILCKLPYWVRKGVIKSQNWKELVDILVYLPERIKSADVLDAELRCDILYFAGDLVKEMLRVNPKDRELEICRNIWRDVELSRRYPQDVIPHMG